ncbi:hypothetical protein ILUMI_08003 [Ignelater luminosus]|uniref:Uncharacterized protein n=1 Tax=Ignelater luminosus TaxID=2038154 RepID=A0A8K0GGB7_IGNLU|nr:hypothetical protein ILUMI_08003 [Ignelater luminosus]
MSSYKSNTTVPLCCISRSSVACMPEVATAFLKKGRILLPPFKEFLKKASCNAIAIDESCDIVGDEQMSIFMPFFDIESEVFRDALLAILPFKGNTCGEDLFKAFDDFMTKSSFNCDKVVSISTDGVLTMIGKEESLDRQFKEFLSEWEVIECFWQIKEEATTFLGNLDTEEARKYLEFLAIEYDMLAVAFLKDILKYLNTLNTELRGNGKLICDLIQSVFAFRCKLDIFEKGIENQKFIDFPTVLEYRKNSEIDTAVFLSFMADLGKEFAEIGKVSQFLKTSYDVILAEEWIDVAAKLFRLSKSLLQMEMVDLQEDIFLKMCKTVSSEEFWTERVLVKHENCKN